MMTTLLWVGEKSCFFVNLREAFGVLNDEGVIYIYIYIYSIKTLIIVLFVNNKLAMRLSRL